MLIHKLFVAAFLFRPDSTGPGGLTPLHIAAGLDDTDDLVDVLTEDPQSVGIEAWKSILDYSGFTPHDYTCLRDHYSYIHMAQRKQLSKKHGQMVIDVPVTGVDVAAITKQKMGDVNSKAVIFHTEKSMEDVMSCRKCEQMVSYGSPKPSISLYRPAMLLMVLIAAVCVCADGVVWKPETIDLVVQTCYAFDGFDCCCVRVCCIAIKSSLEVVYLFRPFRWEMLKYGAE